MNVLQTPRYANIRMNAQLGYEVTNKRQRARFHARMADITFTELCDTLAIRHSRYSAMDYDMLTDDQLSQVAIHAVIIEDSILSWLRAHKR